jgi:PmbA protein
VKKGVIVHPVEEVTVAGNMKDMLLNIVAVSNDTYMNSSRYTGSILIDGMTVASG